MPHVCDGEDGVEHPTLFAMTLADGCEQAVTEQQVALAMRRFIVRPVFST